MNKIKQFVNHPYFCWALLSLPALPMLGLLISTRDPTVYHRLLHPTGEFAARFMILAMMITPLVMLLPSWRGPRWLRQRRRYIGVAAFSYALVHTVFYLIDAGSVAFSLSELTKTAIWSGWLAMLIFMPLAITSTDGWVREMGSLWKTLQRTIYIAALATLLHWAALHEWGGVGPALVHFLPLGLLTGYRIFRNASPRRKDAMSV
ncbi:MAG: sulfite oxidase heme-binding subunit YedZ [Hyphomicrobiaceae bacterium]